MEDLRRARAILNTGNYTCVLCRGEDFHTATARGVRPLVDWLDSGRDFRGYSAADKVVGRATAFLYRLLGVRAVHALVMSAPAREALVAGGIDASCDREVSGIINRRGDGPCPFENAVLGITDEQEALTAIRKKQLQMQLPEHMRGILSGQDFTLEQTGMSGATIARFPSTVLKIEPVSPNAATETAMLCWLNGKLPVPRILEATEDYGISRILMTRLPGVMACDSSLHSNPWHLTRELARGLQKLWAVDVSGCPSDQSLEAKFARLESAPLEMDASVDRREFPTAAHLLHWLKANRPPEQQVLTHGDYCLPNLFFAEGKLTGFLDLGRSGVGDPWVDIAICWRSLRDNFGGHYGDAVEGFSPDYLFECLGMEKDETRLHYFLMLDELF